MCHHSSKLDYKKKLQIDKQSDFDTFDKIIISNIKYDIKAYNNIRLKTICSLFFHACRCEQNFLSAENEMEIKKISLFS